MLLNDPLPKGASFSSANGAILDIGLMSAILSILQNKLISNSASAEDKKSLLWSLKHIEEDIISYLSTFSENTIRERGHLTVDDQDHIDDIKRLLQTIAVCRQQ